MFDKLYASVDANRTPPDVWDAAQTHFASIGEAIRRMHFTDLLEAASHAFCWMCSFVLACNREERSVFKMTESFSAIVGVKYSLVCGHCRQSYCQCNPQLMDKTKNKAALYRELLKLRSSRLGALGSYGVNLWLDEFKRIYGQHIHMLTLESIGFHFLEEAGEEVTALRGLKQLRNVADAGFEGIDLAFLDKLSSYEGALDVYEGCPAEEVKPQTPGHRARLAHAKVEMYVEFADTFSWLCSILNKVAAVAANCTADGGNGDRCRFAGHPFHEKLRSESRWRHASMSPVQKMPVRLRLLYQVMRKGISAHAERGR